MLLVLAVFALVRGACGGCDGDDDVASCPVRTCCGYALLNLFMLVFKFNSLNHFYWN